MAEGLRCTVVTPAEALFDEPADYVNLPAWDGQLGVMPGTSPFLTRVGVGVLTVTRGSNRKEFAVGGGFAQMQDGLLTLLADNATAADSIERSKVERELASVEEKLADAGTTTARQRETLDRARRFAFTKLSLARR